MMSHHPTDEALATWLERDPSEGEDIWEHIFACASCTKRAEELRAVVVALEEIGESAHNGNPSVAELRALERRGVRLQHATGINGGEQAVAIGEIDILAMHLPLATTIEAPVHIELCRRDGQVFFAIDGRSEGSEVIIACHASVARANPALRVRVRPKGDNGPVIFDGLFVHA